ncbi:hypothetical protein E2C01_006345 [Portunus trituberculatus]|uniref:Uncharacterized protein n=1 Tax=Portunus trituberculatus TaxID=210409 RepID=A0A5B7CXX5_PORTR|nr:hypothetical protein [Portunus trituberculatus]
MGGRGELYSSATFPKNAIYLRGQHSSVGGGLVTVSLHLLATGDAHDGLPARQISDVHEGVVVAGVNVAHSEHLLSIQHLWSQLDLHLLLLGLSLTWSHDLAAEQAAEGLRLEHYREQDLQSGTKHRRPQEEEEEEEVK